MQWLPGVGGPCADCVLHLECRMVIRDEGIQAALARTYPTAINVHNASMKAVCRGTLLMVCSGIHKCVLEEALLVVCDLSFS